MGNGHGLTALPARTRLAGELISNLGPHAAVETLYPQSVLEERWKKSYPAVLHKPIDRNFVRRRESTVVITTASPGDRLDVLASHQPDLFIQHRCGRSRVVSTTKRQETACPLPSWRWLVRGIRLPISWPIGSNLIT